MLIKFKLLILIIMSRKLSKHLALSKILSKLKKIHIFIQNLIIKESTLKKKIRISI